LFHLSMLINGKYELEKNAVISFKQNPSAVKNNSETLNVPITGDITISNLIDNTKKQMGANFGPYNAETNNCSVFLSNVLSANGLTTEASTTFVNQKTAELFSKFSKLTKPIVDAATTAGAVADRLIEGEGSRIHNFGLQEIALF